MKKVSKSIKICIALGILFGLILLFIKLRLQLSEEETMRIYIFSSIAVLLISVIIKFLLRKENQRPNSLTWRSKV